MRPVQAIYCAVHRGAPVHTRTHTHKTLLLQPTHTHTSTHIRLYTYNHLNRCLYNRHDDASHRRHYMHKMNLHKIHQFTHHQTHREAKAKGRGRTSGGRWWWWSLSRSLSFSGSAPTLLSSMCPILFIYLCCIWLWYMVMSSLSIYWFCFQAFVKNCQQRFFFADLRVCFVFFLVAKNPLHPLYWHHRRIQKKFRGGDILNYVCKHILVYIYKYCLYVFYMVLMFVKSYFSIWMGYNILIQFNKCKIFFRKNIVLHSINVLFNLNVITINLSICY